MGAVFGTGGHTSCDCHENRTRHTTNRKRRFAAYFYRLFVWFDNGQRYWADRGSQPFEERVRVLLYIYKA